MPTQPDQLVVGQRKQFAGGCHPGLGVVVQRVGAHLRRDFFAASQANPIETALGFGRRDLGVGELGSRFRTLILAAGGRFDVVGGLEILQRAVGVGGLLLQFDQAILQPLARDLGRLELGVQGCRDVAVGQGIGDLGRLVACLPT